MSTSTQSGFIQLYLDDGQKESFRKLYIKESATIAELYEKIATMRNTNAEYFVLLSTERQELKMDMTLKECRLYNGSTIVFTSRLHGGSNLKPLEGFVEPTDDPCDLTYDDTKGEKRAKMPCGCVLAVNSVEKQANETLNKGDFNFKCPNCEKELDFFLINHVLSAKLEDAQLTETAKKVTGNFVQMQQDIRQCGTCNSYCIRDFTKWFGNKNRVTCNTCTERNGGSAVDFCWICGLKWKGGAGNKCGNEACKDIIVERLRILQQCKTKTIGSVEGCPDTRACPKCGTMTSHIDACKHVKCRCGCEFCFVCLKPKDANGQWQCGAHSSVCQIADRQTSLPQLQ